MTRRFAWVPLCFLVVLFGCMPEYSLRLGNNAAGSRVRGGGGREVIVFASNDARPVRDRCPELGREYGVAAQGTQGAEPDKVSP